VSESGSLVARWLFLRALGITSAIAFVSLGAQIQGLVGPEGILPAGDHLELVETVSPGAARFAVAPTLCWWIGTSDAALQSLYGAGVLLSLALLAGVMPGLMCALLWLLYLSLVVVGNVFFSFQWDVLLLETLALAAFVAPWKPWAPGLATDEPPPRVAVWLVRLLLFKLMFMSGAVKLASGDPTWRNLTALEYHYWTTCLPAWPGWYAHWLPATLHRVMAVLMFAGELAVPFLVFTTTRLRAIAALGIALLQGAIAITGNYGFFNLLTIALCLMLLDDSIFGFDAAEHPFQPLRRRRVVRGLAWAMAAVFGVLSWAQLQGRLLGYDGLPRFALEVVRLAQPWRTINGYGLFANMTTERHEIVVEGSYDGKTWKAYEFRWKPGDPARRPEFVQPHMPRLDWQMWFAALGSYRAQPWFVPFLGRVAEGSPPVVALLGSNPFPDRPPRYVRATLWSYRFAEPEAHAETGAWWVREELGLYCPVFDAERPGRPLTAGPSSAGSPARTLPARAPGPGRGSRPAARRGRA